MSQDTHTQTTRLAAVEAERDEIRCELKKALRRWVDVEIELSAALARAERAEKAIRDYLDGNYDHPRAHRPGKCRHEIWYWEPCENCIDEHFTAAITDPTLNPVKDA